MFRRRLIIAKGRGIAIEGIPSSEAVAGDICIYGINEGKLIIVNDWDVSKYPISKYPPIGVVVVPGNHNIYGDGSCGVMSLKEMDCSSPDTGSSSHQSVLWGDYNTDTSLPNLDDICYIGQGNSLNEDVQGTYDNCNIPSDKFSAVNNPYDSSTGYYSASTSYKQAPSPYKNDGSRNPAYYQTSSPSTITNALADFDGIGNSEILWGLATSQSNWKTASSITQNIGAGYYPSACCCWRYHTKGTQQGQWYLPACGELGYIMPRFVKINETITNLINAFDSSVGVTLDSNSNYWSSSEYSNNKARSVYTGSGGMYVLNKSNEYRVRAFLRVK